MQTLVENLEDSFFFFQLNVFTLIFLVKINDSWLKKKQMSDEISLVDGV